MHAVVVVVVQVQRCSTSVNRNYMVVIFTTEGEEFVSAAPSKWLLEDTKLMWPPTKNMERKAIKLSMHPENDWICYNDVRVVGYYATLTEAINVEKDKQNSTSCSEAEVRGKEKRKIRKNYKYRDDSISPPPGVDERDLPTVNDIINAKIILETPPAVVLEIEKHEENTKISRADCIVISEASGSNIIGHDNMASSSNNVVQHSPSIYNLKKTPSDTESIQSDSAKGGSSISGNSSIDELVSEMKQIKHFVMYTMRKVESLEITLAKHKTVKSLEPHKTLLPKLPLMEIAQLRTLEDNLGNENIQRELFDMLRHTGGAKERDCVTRCLEKVFSNYLGQYCSWTGKKNNYKLSSMNLMTTIKIAVRETFPNITDDSFERHVMGWFQHASTRLKREN